MSERQGLRRFLNPQDAMDAIEEVLDIAQEDGATVALCGGLAMQMYGSDRLTTDVDMVGDSLPKGEWSPLSFGGGAAVASNGVDVDIIVRDDDFSSLYEEALKYFRVIDDIPVVTMEHMAAMKLAAHRGKDLQDLHWLVLHKDFNMKTAEQIVKNHLGPHAVNDFRSEVQMARLEAGSQETLPRPSLRPRKNPRSRR